MPYLVKSAGMVTARNVNGESINHAPGTVLSDWELEPYVRDKISEGSEHYRRLFEPLTEREAHDYRVRATQNERPHMIDGVAVPSPFDDYVGLHPAEVVQRLREHGPVIAAAARRYEMAGMRREQILNFVHPAEREPWAGYNNMDVNGIAEKFLILSDIQVEEAKVYERAHANRPAVVEWDKETEQAPVAA